MICPPEHHRRRLADRADVEFPGRRCSTGRSKIFCAGSPAGQSLADPDAVMDAALSDRRPRGLLPAAKSSRSSGQASTCAEASAHAVTSRCWSTMKSQFFAASWRARRRRSPARGCAPAHRPIHVRQAARSRPRAGVYTPCITVAGSKISDDSRRSQLAFTTPDRLRRRGSRSSSSTSSASPAIPDFGNEAGELRRRERERTGPPGTRRTRE